MNLGYIAQIRNYIKNMIRKIYHIHSCPLHLVSLPLHLLTPLGNHLFCLFLFDVLLHICVYNFLPFLHKRHQTVFPALCLVFFLPNNISNLSWKIHVVHTYLPHSSLLLYTSVSSPMLLLLLFSLKTSGLVYIFLLASVAFVYTLLVLIGI